MVGGESTTLQGRADKAELGGNYLGKPVGTKEGGRIRRRPPKLNRVVGGLE